jgi:putative aldouronate transport system substrate-binding protein
MNNRILKMIVTLVAVTMIVTMFAACSKSGESAKIETQTAENGQAQENTDREEATEKEEQTEKAEQTEGENEPYIMTQFVNFSWYPDERMDITSLSWQEIIKKTGVTPQIEKPATDDNQKLNILIASDNLPDVITLDKNDINVGKLTSGGKVHCLNDLIEEYAPDMYNNIEPEYFKYHKYTDGKNYYFTNFIETDYCLQQPYYYRADTSLPIAMIQKEIYEALGKPDVTTPDGFFNMLKDIKSKYPDLIPFYEGHYNPDTDFFKMYEPSGNLYLLGQFGLGRYDVSNGKVTSVVRNSKFLDFIKYSNMLYREGIFAPEAFIDNSDVAEDKLKNAKFAVFVWNWEALRSAGSKKEYVMLPYFKTAIVNKAMSGWTATVITKNAKDVKRVMDFFDFITTEEGRRLTTWGVEGITWEMVDGNPYYTEELSQLMDKAEKTPEDSAEIAKHGISCFMWLQDQWHCNWIRKPGGADDTDRKALVEMYGEYRFTDIFLGLMDPLGDSEEGVIQNKLRDIAKTYYPKMVMAEDEESVVAIYNEFMKKCEDLGLAKLEEAWTKKYQQFN